MIRHFDDKIEINFLIGRNDWFLLQVGFYVCPA